MDEEVYTDFNQDGMYSCSNCANQLFPSSAKFKSGTIWPSFRKAIPGTVKTRPDYSQGAVRTEILCAKCGQHLGHVFDDGKLCGDIHPEAGNRFCVLSSALSFENKDKKANKKI